MPVQHRIIDPVHQHMIVAAFEHPDSWQAQSAVTWNMQDTSHPAVVRAAAWEPGGAASFEFLPVEACYWLEPNYGMYPIGQPRFGLILLPPGPVLDVMTRWLVPKYRQGRERLRITAAQPMPTLARMLNANELRNAQTEGGMVRVEYGEVGRAFAEEFYACRYQLPPHYGAVSQINWGLIRVFCFRAAPERLEALRPALWRTATSLFYNPPWQALFEQVTARLNGQFNAVIQAGFDKLRDEANFQQQLTAYYQSQRDHQNAAVAASIAQQHQRNDDRAGAGYSAQDAASDAALMNRTAYEDPSNAVGNPHYEYGNAAYVWTDGQGTFIGRDDPNFDPNRGSDRSWTLARKLRG